VTLQLLYIYNVLNRIVKRLPARHAVDTMLKHSAADLKASPLPPTLMLPSWSHLELQVSWWSFGAQGCHLKLQVAIWRSRWALELQVAVWSSRWPCAGPGSHLQVQVVIWMSRVPFGGPGGRLEVQVAVWSSKWPRGAPNGRLELQCGPGGLAGCGSLWRAVAGCGSRVVSLWPWRFAGLWRPVAACGSGVVSLLETFTLRI